MVTVTPVRVSVRSQNPFSFRRDNLPPKRGPFAPSTEVEPTASKRAASHPSGRDFAGEDYILPPTGGEPAAPFSGVGDPLLRLRMLRLLLTYLRPRALRPVPPHQLASVLVGSFGLKPPNLNLDPLGPRGRCPRLVVTLVLVQQWRMR